MMADQILLSFIWVASLAYALTNGLHDAGAVVSTVVASRAASPRLAVALSAVASLAGAILGGQAVTQTFSSLIRVDPDDRKLLPLLVAAVLGAVIWNFLTWRVGLPSSSTHALVGGCVGSSLVWAGWDSIQWLPGAATGNQPPTFGIMGVFITLLMSPLIGFLAAFSLEKSSQYILSRARYALNRWLNRAQLPLMLLLSFSHGSNDAQKITGILILAGLASRQCGQVSVGWPLSLAGLAIFFGTLFGSWPIIRTLSRGIFQVRPINGFNAQLAASASLLAATILGAPASTSHIVVGSVLGTGAAVRYKAVNWQVAKGILAAWLVTVPASALIAAVFAGFLRFMLEVTGQSG